MRDQPPGREGYRTPGDAVMLTGFLHRARSCSLCVPCPARVDLAPRGTREVRFKLGPAVSSVYPLIQPNQTENEAS